LGPYEEKWREQMKRNYSLMYVAARVVHSWWANEEGQDIAEYAVMMAVILIIVVGTLRLIGSHTNTVFSNVASSIG
jgi:Flp pilus assembly pilin Flp